MGDFTNPLWAAAEALLVLAKDCLGESCEAYPRVLIETQSPVADCATLAVVIGNARAYSGSCVGKLQLSATLDIVLIRCCDPVGDLTTSGGYTPPSVEAIQQAAACVARDAWAIYQCVVCTACDLIGAVKNVTACCDDKTGAPEIVWGSSMGGCRSATIRVPLIVTTCCTPEI